MDALVADRTA